MKKVFIFVFEIVVTMSMFTGCGNGDEKPPLT